MRRRRLAGWARGSPLAQKWDDAASDAIEDLIIAAVRSEQQSSTGGGAILGAQRLHTVLFEVRIVVLVLVGHYFKPHTQLRREDTQRA